MDSRSQHQAAVVHPAAGFVRVDASDSVWPFTDEELGSRWASLPDDQAAQVERRFFVWLLSELASTDAVVTELDVPHTEERDLLERTLPAAAGENDSVPLSKVLVEALVAVNPVILEIQRQGQTVLFLHDGWPGVRLSLPGDEIDALEAHARERGLTLR